MASFVENANVKNEYFTRLQLDDEDGSEFTDRWNTGELLCLASAVQRSGDKNWVSVSRSIKPFGEPRRPADWYTPKNCALQYSKLLKGVEDFKKKSLPRTERETSEELLVKNLTDKRVTELNWLNQQTRVLANSMKVHMELLESGEYDEHLDELMRQIEEQEKKEEDDFREWLIKRDSLNAAKKLNKCRIPLSKGKAPSRNLDAKRKNSPNPDHLDDISMHSMLTDITIKQEIDSDQEILVNSKPITIKQEPPDVPSSISALLDGSKISNIAAPTSVPTTPTSPLLTSLLRSVPSSNATSPVVSYVSSPLKEVKTENPSQSSPSSTDNIRKTEVFLSPTKTVTASVSPLLTSLLKSPTSTVPTSTSMASHCKEVEGTDNKSIEIDMAALIAKSQETSPRSSVSHSPRPTPASSPLLNSLLKSSPSSGSSLSSHQLSQNKEIGSSKASSSPQPFFSPTNALATAAAQQLAVATSSFSTSHIFFPQDSSDSPKKSSQSSTTTSACLSAPTLSKLLEMPPSTPGKLPPLPVIETPTVSASVSEAQVITQSPTTVPTANMLLNELELQLSSTSPSKIPSETISSSDITTVSNVVEQTETSVPISSIETLSALDSSNIDTKVLTVEQTTPFKHPMEMDDRTQKNVDILEAVCESYKAMPLEKKENRELSNSDTNNLLVEIKTEPLDDGYDLQDAMIKAEKVMPDEMLDEDVDIEKFLSSDIGFDEKVFTSEDISVQSDLNIFESDKQKDDLEADNPPATILQSSETSENLEDDKSIGRKFYKSRSISKKQLPSEEDIEQSTEVASPLKQGTKRLLKSPKIENETISQVSANEQLLLAAKEAEEATLRQTPDKSPTKSEIRSPASKKPRLFEKVAVKEIKKECSEDEAPIVKRPGRRGKKGRRAAKYTPIKQEPKDQYEFSESTEENSVGYQTTSTLCYMPRLKEDRHEEIKTRQSQNSESVTSAVTSTTPEKKHGTPVKKSGRIPPHSSGQKSLFTSDEERMSDSMTSDDASSSHFDDDKLRKWKDFTEKKEEDSIKLPKGTKAAEASKKKLQHTKRNLFSSKDKKNVQSDVEESSVCSRDSEDAGIATAWQREEAEILEAKNTCSNVATEVEMETNDSHMSSSMTVESDTKMDEMEGYESLQGSVTAEFSPLAQTDVKEEKDSSQYGKQDWFQGVSPKSSEAVSQSSEDSDFESDNWDNQSVSTNKSASHSVGPSSKPKRKERESPQYKAWKKAISIVLREASCHKYANVFLQKVTNDVAPGYLNIVYRPMDLSLLKKNVDNGVVKTTAEVHRDMLLMFENAVMYNSSDHDVHHMAVEMQRDVIHQMHAFLTTQYNDKDESNELTSLRGVRAKSQKLYGSTLKIKEEPHEKE